MQLSHMVQQEHVLWKDVNILKSRFCDREDRDSWQATMLVSLSGWADLSRRRPSLAKNEISLP